jgi:hypothetical protein
VLRQVLVQTCAGTNIQPRGPFLRPAACACSGPNLTKIKPDHFAVNPRLPIRKGCCEITPDITASQIGFTAQTKR